MEKDKPCQEIKKVFNKWSKTEEILVRVAAMQAANTIREQQGESLAYGEEAFSEMANKIKRIREGTKLKAEPVKTYWG